MDNPRQIHYHFAFTDGTSSEFNVSLNRITLLAEVPESSVPSWCQLQVAQCTNCPLKIEETPHCPLAMTLSPLVGTFSGRTSHDSATVTVTTEERTISTHTTLQRGLSSLLGLLMATSGCPHTRLFRPMARFHLPFSSAEETTYRAAANYLLSQYFCDGEKRDWQLQGLAESYRALQQVNAGITQRLRQVCEEDAAVNAVILLDLFAKDIPYSIEEALEELSPLFKAGICK